MVPDDARANDGIDGLILPWLTDLAFVDRADIKMHIGNPSTAAAYQILSSAINELARAGIVATSEPAAMSGLPPLPAPPTLLDARELQLFKHALPSDHPSSRLYAIAVKCAGMSGRTLRKLPFLAHAFFVRSETVGLDGYLGALERAVEKELLERGKMAAGMGC